MKVNILTLLVSASTLALVGAPGVAYAQATAPQAAADADAQADEIVVTGSRLRSEAVQQTPVTVSVINARAVESLHATNITALNSVVPNLVVTEQGSSPGVGGVFIRGFGTFSADVSLEPGITVYVDGVFQAVAAGSLSNLFDIERVEVLRGPQSSLLGKNASAGAVLITHTKPSTTQFSGKIAAETGSYGLAQFQGLVNVPVVEDKLAVKLYGLYRDRGSWIRNVFPGGANSGSEKTGIVRAGVLFTPTPDISLYLSGDYDRERPGQLTGRNIVPARGVPCVVFNVCTNQVGQYHVSNANYSGTNKIDDYHTVANFEWSTGPVKISSISGYRHRTMLNQADADATPLTLVHVYNNRYLINTTSEEFRLSSEKDGGLDLDGKLSWVIGGFYSDVRAEDAQPFMTQSSPTAPVALTTQAQRSDRTTKAVFGQAEYNITDALSASFGGRYSKDSVTHRFSLRGLGTSTRPALPNVQSRTDSNTSFEGGVKYKFDATKMVYLRYAEGYRGGGFIGRPSSLAQAAGGFGPETSKSVEFGAKTEFFDRKLLFNLTLYTVKFNDLQRTVNIPNGATFTTLTANVAKATTKGFEIETVVKPTPEFNIPGTLGYLDAKYRSYISNGVDLSGTPFSFAPKWTASVTPSYQIDLGGGFADSLNLSATYSYKSSQYVSSTIDPRAFQKGYGFVNVQATLARGPFDLTAYVNNVTKKKWIESAQTIGAETMPTSSLVLDNIGRVWGLSASMKF